MCQTYRATQTYASTEARALLTYVSVLLALPVSTARHVSNCFQIHVRVF